MNASTDLVQPGVRLSRTAVVRNLILKADHELNERFEAFVVEVAAVMGEGDFDEHRDIIRLA